MVTMALPYAGSTTAAPTRFERERRHGRRTFQGIGLVLMGVVPIWGTVVGLVFL